MGDMWLVVMDTKSKWPHVLKLSKYPTTETMISALNDLFTLWGLPDTLVSDNGTQFTSVAFAEWYVQHAITHLTSAPFHPPSNGEAERLNGVFKQATKRAAGEGKTKHQALREFPVNYRSTPSCSTGRTPAEMMLCRQFRYPLSMLQPIKKVAPSSPKHQLAVGDYVYFREYTRRTKRWLPGRFAGHIGLKMCLIESDDGQVRRHIGQINRSYEPKNLRQPTATRMEMPPDSNIYNIVVSKTLPYVISHLSLGRETLVVVKVVRVQ